MDISELARRSAVDQGILRAHIRAEREIQFSDLRPVFAALGSSLIDAGFDCGLTEAID